ncbi:DUF3862 domain-containing protein [uncultured Desulfobacter sp.]|uniref:DUF3862 domain-containing protein n=1 Tax=uncultured Desulfobacter sp. TaxID=240139 RepID=UPI0029F48C74|nr:DUF3862 domain-containing protein [uncultured Desulfobacter sp.]
MKFKKLVVLVFLCAVVFPGCSKVTRENFDKINMGMGYKDVVEIIGEPDSCDGALGAKKCVWGNETKNITISFIGEKVILPAMKGL